MTRVEGSCCVSHACSLLEQAQADARVDVAALVLAFLDLGFVGFEAAEA
jgi:hypothetical protein